MALTAQQQTLVDKAKKGGVVTTAQITAVGLTPTTFNQAVKGTYTGPTTTPTPVVAPVAPTPVAPTPAAPTTAQLQATANAAYNTFLNNQTQANLDAWAAAAKTAGQDVTANVANYQQAITKAAQTQAQQAAQAAAQPVAPTPVAPVAPTQTAAEIAAQATAAAAAKADADKAAQAQALAAQQAAAQQAQALALAQQEAEKQAQATAFAEQQRIAQEQQAAAQAAADAQHAAELKAQQDAQAKAAADFAAQQGAIDAANNARIQAATDKSAMLTIAQNAAGVPGGKDLLGNYSTPQEALTNAQTAYAAAQKAYDSYTGSDVNQRAQLAANLNNAAQLNSFLTRDLATNYAQANQNLPAVNQQYTQATQTLQQAQNAVTAQQEQASVAKSVADRAAMDKPFGDINWGAVGAAALLAVGIADPSLLGLADAGALTPEALTTAGVAPEATAEAIATGIEGGTIPAEAAPEIASTVAEASPVAPESIATETLTPPVEAGPVAPEVPVSSTVPPGQPITELNAQQTAELMKNVDPNMVNSLQPVEPVPTETPYRVDVSGAAGTAEAPGYAVTESMTPGSQLATQAEIDAGAATWNPAANAWEVTAAAPTALSPVVPGVESLGATGAGGSVYGAGGALNVPEVVVGAGGGASAISPAVLAAGGVAAAGLGGGGAGGAAGGGGGTAAPTTTPVEPVATTPVTTTPTVEPPPLSPVEPVTLTPSQPIPEVQAVSPAPTPVETPPAPYTGPGIGEVPNPAEVPVTDLSTPAVPMGPSPYDWVAPAAAGAVGGALLAGALTPAPGGPKKPNYGPLPPNQWGTPPAPGTSGLNPGYLMGITPAEYSGTPTQATHYWGVHPYVTDLAHIQDYNQLPPGQAWGAEYAQGVGPNRLNVQQLINQVLGPKAQAAAVGTAYPGPIAPANKG